MKGWNQIQILYTQLMKMNKPQRHKSKIIQKIQEQRSSADFEKTKKRMQLAVMIQDAIKAKGISYTQFAAIMDQHASVVSKWVSGTHNFTADTLFDIEDNLGISLIGIAADEPREIVHKYSLEVSIKAEDIVSSDFIPISLFNERRLHQYISHCGGMAVTSVSVQS